MDNIVTNFDTPLGRDLMTNENTTQRYNGGYSWLFYAFYPIAKCLQVLGLSHPDERREPTPPPPPRHQPASAPEARSPAPSVSFENAPPRRASSSISASPFANAVGKPSDSSRSDPREGKPPHKKADNKPKADDKSVQFNQVASANCGASKAPHPQKKLPKVDTTGATPRRQPKDSQSLSAVSDKLGKAAATAAADIPQAVVDANQCNAVSGSSGTSKETHSRDNSPPGDRQQKKQKRSGEGQRPVVLSRAIGREPLVAASSGGANVSASPIAQDDPDMKGKPAATTKAPRTAQSKGSPFTGNGTSEKTLSSKEEPVTARTKQTVVASDKLAAPKAGTDANLPVSTGSKIPAVADSTHADAKSTAGAAKSTSESKLPVAAVSETATSPKGAPTAAKGTVTAAKETVTAANGTPAVGKETATAAKGTAAAADTKHAVEKQPSAATKGVPSASGPQAQSSSQSTSADDDSPPVAKQDPPASSSVPSQPLSTQAAKNLRKKQKRNKKKAEATGA